MAEKRRTHIYRVLGTTKSGQDNSVWLDLERLEYYQLQEGGGQDFKRTGVKLKWYLDDAGLIPNPSRKTTTLRILPPDEDPQNPKLWFEVDVVDMIKVRDNDQIIYVHFNNEDDNRGRTVKVRRIVHYDTTADELPQYQNGGVIPKDIYRKLSDTRDKEQYVDTEIILKRGFRDVDQLTFTRYNNQALIDASEVPDTAYAEGQINPPWRLDPLQTIHNISLSPTVIVAFAFPVSGSARSLHESAIYLGSRTLTEPLMGVHFFKLNAGLGEAFAETTAPNFADLVALNWMVLPWLGEDAGSNIDRAFDAVRQFATANVFEDPLGVLSPQGVLWHGFFFQLAGGSRQTFKIDYTAHRPPGPSSLPNTMVQCFPLRSVPSSVVSAGFTVTNQGFNIHFYRLDRKGEGPAYDPPTEWARDAAQTITPDGGTNYGCLFRDDMPLAAADRPYSNIFGKVGLSVPS